jgi:hypothetical protein
MKTNKKKDFDMYKDFRNGIVRAPSRTYGEKYIEPIIRELFGWDETDGDENDAKDKDGKCKEIKSSKVLRSNSKKTKTSLVESIFSQNDNDMVNRLIPSSQCYTSDYLSNFQNVKRDHFDQLEYIMLFEDCVKIFMVDKHNVSNIPNWCDKHGRYDELGKSGQFGITKNNIEWHLQNTLVKTLTWKEVYEIAKKIK